MDTEIIKYPIGIQTFEKIREGNYLYVDKTRYVYELVNNGYSHVFLSRPRRFGKSLFVSTLQAYFEGRKELFEGLEIARYETQWVSYPVLRFDFSGLEAKDPDVMKKDIHQMINLYESKFEVEVYDISSSIGTRFGMLIQNIAEKTGKRVVVLIDEYDKGIVEVLQHQEQLSQNIDTLRPFYSQLKAQDANLKFAFLTGVSRFRNLTLFSSPNQLNDISMDEEYAAICGITEKELHSVFVNGIAALAEKQDISVEDAKYQLKLNYDCYRFTAEKVHVYNPFSILCCLAKKRIGDYWLTSGGATKVFIDYLKNADYNLEQIENRWVRPETLGGPYNLEDPVPLLFQTGYLTICDYDDGMFRVGIPNGEVRSALVDQLVPLYMGINNEEAYMLSRKLGKLANSGDAERLLLQFQSILAQATYQHFRFNDVENVYNLSLWLICKMSGINARSEQAVAGGSIDMVIETQHYVYVFEFKKDQSAEKALEQIDSHAYALSWKADGRMVYKIGVEFSSANRNITRWIIAADPSETRPDAHSKSH